MKIAKNGRTESLTLGLMIAAVFMVAFNAFQLNQINDVTSPNSGNSLASASSLSSSIDVTPKGIPNIYGKELGVSYDDVSALNQQKADSTIRVLGALDNTITLTEEQNKRYIEIVSKISCEYCCGAKSIIFSDGQPACGCAHSYAMRGLAKYLITKHGTEYTDNEILEELGKWKTLFFPSQIAAKAEILKQKGIELNYINLASNIYRGVEQQAAGGGMVGGC